MKYSMRPPVAALIVVGVGMVVGACDPEPVRLDAGTDAGPMVEPDAGTDAGAPDAGPPCEGPPGLYEDDACQIVALGVRPYTTRFNLWADGADKERYIALPEGTQIDTTDPDNWVFPVGTRVYKTFLRDGVRLETRILEKTDPGTGLGAWDMRVYAWNEAQNAVEDVTNEPLVVRSDVLGTTHDIPSGADCVRCHGGRDVVNGFSAIMLNHDRGGVTLATLTDEGRLTTPVSAAAATVPGDAAAVEALGYLHANCGNCHRETTSDPAAASTGMYLWLRTGHATVEETDTYLTTVSEIANYFDADALCRVHPGNPDASLMLTRMQERGGSVQMPPLATEEVHTAGVQMIRTWIASLTADPTDCIP